MSLCNPICHLPPVFEACQTELRDTGDVKYARHDDATSVKEACERQVRDHEKNDIKEDRRHVEEAGEN